jgi:hypothetical protein
MAFPSVDSLNLFDNPNSGALRLQCGKTGKFAADHNAGSDGPERTFGSLNAGRRGTIGTLRDALGLRSYVRLISNLG